MSNEGWGVNRPSIEYSDLTTARKIMPHATSPNREKADSVGDQGANARERGRGTLEKHKESDRREEGE
jgi:hypothetical protein